MIAIIDYEMGNLRSVQKAFERVGHAAAITSDPRVLAQADKIVLPGVGAFARRDRRAAPPRAGRADPRGDRRGQAVPRHLPGPADAVRRRATKTASTKGSASSPARSCGSTCRAEYKVPHMGWNQRAASAAGRRSSRASTTAPHFYFVHSYYVVPQDESVVAGEATYPEPFCSSDLARQSVRHAVPSGEEPGGGPAAAEELRGAVSCKLRLRKHLAARRLRSRRDCRRLARAMPYALEFGASLCDISRSDCRFRTCAHGTVAVMQIWPAIDLRGGKCVRLRQGDYHRETVFADDPAAVARQFVAQGAQHLHLVDLDGARDGLPVNLRRASQAILDGGRHRVRTRRRHSRRSNRSIELLESRPVAAGDRHLGAQGARLVPRDVPQVSRASWCWASTPATACVATDGWLETSRRPAIELAQQFADEPLAAIIYTDIATDGMLAGPERRGDARDAGGRRRCR